MAGFIVEHATALLFVVLREYLLLIALLVAASSLDDLMIDGLFAFRSLWRQLTVYAVHPRAVAAQLGRERGWMAIVIPAWDESAVIGAMLRNTLATFDYPHYRLFVGSYANDPATVAAVRGVNDPRVACVTVGWTGPTTKADCLNALWRAVAVHERATGVRFKAVVLHDAEDVVDRDELRVFDHLIPHLAMVQLPVMPLPDRHSRWVAGHYMDEFAEAHGKDIIVREAIGAAVPSAGVACAVERAMLGRIADAADGAPFDATCLTEDYELGLRIRALGGRGGLARIANGRGTAAVATREHFPGTLEAAVRQKSRWLLGISLQGWDRLGWPGGIADKWMLARDRKSVATALLTLLAYLGLGASVLLTLARMLCPTLDRLPPLVSTDGWLATLLVFNTAVLGWRLLVRALFTSRAHGWREGVVSVPRAFVGNLINFLAAVRAIRRYLRIARGRERNIWEKTAHRFPVAGTG